MKTKIVYVLTSNSSDCYLEQALISIYSLKIYNREAHIVVIVDSQTADSLHGDREILNDMASEIIVVECPNYLNKLQRSRHLKTSVRQLINGDYLFIDTDTIITAPLNEIDRFDFLIGAVKDKHLSINNHPMARSIERWAKMVRWTIDDNDNDYFNSGVLFVKDDEMTHRFYIRWHEEWYNSMQQGLNLDQPSLGKVNHELPIITEIPGIWNCQITDNGLPYLYDAKILHYFASMQVWDTCNEIPFYFRDKQIYENLKANKFIINESLHKDILNAKSMFKDRTLILAGRNIDIMDTYIFKGLRKLYFRHNRIFNYLEDSISWLKQLF